MDRLYEWFLCVCSISVVLAYLLLSDQSGPNFHQTLSMHWALFSLTTPFAMLRICFLFITPPAALVPIAISFTFLSSVSSSKLGLPAFLNVGLATLRLAFQEFTVVLLKLYRPCLDENFLVDDAVP